MHVGVPQISEKSLPLPLSGRDELVLIPQGVPQAQGVLGAAEHLRVVGGVAAGLEDRDYLQCFSIL